MSIFILVHMGTAMLTSLIQSHLLNGFPATMAAEVAEMDLSFDRKKVALPFSTWVMSYVFPDVMSRHCDNLRIVRHFQKPGQNPFKERQTQVK